MSKPTKNPSAVFHTLPHADGSATYTHAGYTIAASVNGPLEPQRRDELPEEAFVEVHVRPATGTGGPRDRALERLLHRTLLTLIITHAHPRTLIQVTLQILSTPSSGAGTAPPHQSASLLPSLPHLLHAALLALLAANIPLRTTCTVALVAVTSDGMDGEDVDVVVDPEEGVVARALSCHVFAFAAAGAGGGWGGVGTGKMDGKGGGDMDGDGDRDGGEEGELLLVESEGTFDAAAWERAARLAEERCRGTGGLEAWLRGAVGGMVQDAGRWRG